MKEVKYFYFYKKIWI